MKRKIILVDQKTGQKYLITIPFSDNFWECPSCKTRGKAPLAPLAQFREQFEPQTKIFRLICLNCQSIIYETKASSLAEQ